MNKLDSGLVSSAFQKAGYALTEHEADADVILFNTCSVRDNAERRVLSRIGHVGHLKKTKPEIILGVIGCMAQRIGEELMQNPAVDIVCGPGQIPHILELVQKALNDKKKLIEVSEDIRKEPDQFQQDELDDFEFSYDSDQEQVPGQAFIRVMRGCNNFCSYCIVPYVRGPEVSRNPQQILEQAKMLAGEGVKQITLLGQTVNSYKFSEGNKEYRLGDILEMISQIEGIEWIRFITSYPDLGYDEPLFKAMAGIDKVCQYLHMPAQSGSDRILKAMNRHYTADQYLEILDKARDMMPDIAIAGDFIVGFPGETDEDFEQTVDLIKKAQYKNIFAFKYSPRPGTRTEKKFEDNISDEIKKYRNVELLKVQEVISEEYNKRFIKEKVRVLVEGPSKKPHLNKAQNKDYPQLIGRTATDYITVFNGPESLTGNFADVVIEKTKSLTLFGKLAE